VGGAQIKFWKSNPIQNVFKKESVRRIYIKQKQNKGKSNFFQTSVLNKATAAATTTRAT
jgi:hypothetical protein